MARIDARRDARAHAVLLPAAAELADLATHRPRDHLLRVIGDRFLELHPGLREPCHVDGQYQRFHCVKLRPSRNGPERPLHAAKCKV